MNASQQAKQRGARCYAAKDYANAVTYFTEAIERADGDDMDLHLYHSNRCAAYQQLGRWREALEDADATQLLKALDGQTGIQECAFVESSVTDAPYFSTPVTLGPGGVSEVHGYGTLSAYEQDVLDKAVPDLIAQAEKGIAFAAK